jgi:hypothetical protein
LFIMNTTDQPATVALPAGSRDAVGGEPLPEVRLGGWDVRVVRMTQL